MYFDTYLIVNKLNDIQSLKRRITPILKFLKKTSQKIALIQACQNCTIDFELDMMIPVKDRYYL